MYTLKASVFDIGMKALPNVNVQEVNLAGATIGKGTRTAADGTFSLAVTSAASMVRLSYVGYDTVILKASDFGSWQPMTLATEALEEVTIVNEPSPKKKDNTLLWVLGVLAAIAVGAAVLTGKKHTPKKKRIKPHKVTI